jgi:hypothetical protein
MAFWAVLVFGTLAHMRGLAGGLDAFDVRMAGYSPAEAWQLLHALDSEGRDFYARVELPLDTLYPALYALSRCLIFWWLTDPARVSVPPWVRSALLALPIAGACADYVENVQIARMLAGWPDLQPDIAEMASLATRVKFVLGTITDVTALALAVFVLFRWGLRRRTVA